jgi:acetyl-CoA carboxylase biotin carboxyl carrier protein
MDPQQIKAFIDAMAASGLDEMVVSHEGWTLRLARRAAMTTRSDAQVAPAPVAVIAQAETANAPVPEREPSSGPEAVASPMFGVVHLQQAPGEPPFVAPGDVIEPGQIVCTIEAMKVFNEVRAERGGRVSAVLVTSGAEVEAGQALITLEQAADV